MQAIATLDGLFYATGGPKQLEYANGSTRESGGFREREGRGGGVMGNERWTEKQRGTETERQKESERGARTHYLFRSLPYLNGG